MANPFAPPQIDIAGGINDLITQYRTAQVLRKKQELETARKTALQGLMQGGDPTEAVHRLMGIGDVEGAFTLAKAVKMLQPTEIKPMTAYQQWQVGHGEAMQGQADFQKKAAATPQSTKEYWNAYPTTAPSWYREGLGIGGGDQGMPQFAEQPMPTSASPTAQWQPNVEQYKLIQSGKMLRPQEAEKHVNLVITNLDNTRDAAQRLLQDPNLDKAFGGLSNVITRSPSPGAGSGNILPSWMTAGTPIADVQAGIKSLKDQISLAVIANMKEASGKAGSTGLGRVMQIEYAGWQNALGSLEHAQSPEAARNSLRNIISYIDKSKANIQGSLTEDYGPTGNPQAEAPPTTFIPGEQTISTPPPPSGVVPAATPQSPQDMNDQQTISLARQLRQQGLNKQQIIDWFKARGVTIEP